MVCIIDFLDILGPIFILWVTGSRLFNYLFDNSNVGVEWEIGIIGCRWQQWCGGVVPMQSMTTHNYTLIYLT